MLFRSVNSAAIIYGPNPTPNTFLSNDRFNPILDNPNPRIRYRSFIDRSSVPHEANFFHVEFERVVVCAIPWQLGHLTPVRGGPAIGAVFFAVSGQILRIDAELHHAVKD